MKKIAEIKIVILKIEINMNFQKLPLYVELFDFGKKKELFFEISYYTKTLSVVENLTIL